VAQFFTSSVQCRLPPPRHRAAQQHQVRVLHRQHGGRQRRPAQLPRPFLKLAAAATFSAVVAATSDRGGATCPTGHRGARAARVPRLPLPLPWW
jgi:hypothetical protein